MGEGARVEELQITPEICAAVMVDSQELRASGEMLVAVSTQFRAHVGALESVDAALNHAYAVPGGAVSAAPVKAAVGMSIHRLRLLVYEVERLGAAAVRAAERYEDTEQTAWQRFSAGVHAGAGWWQRQFGTPIPMPLDPLLAPANRFLTAMSDTHMQALTAHPLALLTSPQQRIAAIFSSGMVRYNQLRGLSPMGWFRLLPDSIRAGRGLTRALAPITDPAESGLNRAEAAVFARALSAVIVPGGDVGDGAGAGAAVVRTIHAGLGHESIRIDRVEPKHADRIRDRSPVRSFEESIAVMEELEVASGASPGEVRVDRVTSAEGEHSWQVFIPGGQGFDPRNVHSLLHTVSSVDSQPTPSAAMVVSVLRTVGAQKGEPIVMVGHSHGGITASMLANDPRVRAEFDVPLVITAGSPVDRHDIRPDTHVVTLEHTEDFVTGLDGVSWQAKPGMTRVDRTLGESSDPGAAGGVGPIHSHDYPTYIDTARLADAHPELEHTRSHLKALIPEGQVETFRFRADITR